MKKSYFLILLISFFFLNCTKKEEVKNEVYIISKEDSNNKKRGNNSIPTPPAFNYGSNIFIIDKDTTIFYFQQPYFFICQTDCNKSHPPYLFGFTKEDFIEIPKSTIKEFVLLNFKGGEKNHIDIASQIDTLNSDVALNLINTIRQCKLAKDGDRLIIRRTTQEEDSVIEYKKKRKEYYYKNIKWDTSRIDTITYKFLKRPK